MTNMLIEFSVSNFLSFKDKISFSLAKSALKDKKIEATSIGRLLRNDCGYSISDRSVQTYRKDILWR